MSSLRRIRDKNAKRTDPGEADTVIATAGEVVAHLYDEDDGQIAAEEAGTKVRTAVAWLEESGLAERLDNQTTIYPSSLRVAHMSEIRGILHHHRGLERYYIVQLERIAYRLLNADPALGISTDELAAHTGMTPEQVGKALGDLETLGITANNVRITAYVHVGVARPSERRYKQAADMEADLIALMREQAPDQETGGTLPLQLRATAQDEEPGQRARPAPPGAARPQVHRVGRHRARCRRSQPQGKEQPKRDRRCHPEHRLEHSGRDLNQSPPGLPQHPDPPADPGQRTEGRRPAG